MSKAGRDPSARSARERARLYEARRDFHAGLERRRLRDNLVAGIVGGLLVIGIAAAQTAYFIVGPGSPGAEPLPTPTASPSVAPTPSGTPAPDEGGLPTPTPTETD